MNLNKDPESWAKVDPAIVFVGSQGQRFNVFTMALQDIRAMAEEIDRLRSILVIKTLSWEEDGEFGIICADAGVCQTYEVEKYFGTDCYGWEVRRDGVKIGDFDGPDRAKEFAQSDFVSRIRSAFEGAT